MEEQNEIKIDWNEVPTPASDIQIQTFWTLEKWKESKEIFTEKFLYKRFFSSCPKIYIRFIEKINQLVAKKEPDSIIYKELHKFLHTELFESEEYKKFTLRAATLSFVKIQEQKI